MTLKSATAKSKVSRLSGLDYKPLAYMKRAIRWLLEHPAAALFLDPGLGKTGITLGAICILLKKGMATRTLVVAPLRVIYSVWPREVDKWKDFQHLKVAICHGKNKEEAIRSDANLYLVNPEGLEWFLKNWKLVQPEILVIDESTKFKNSASKRFKMLKPFLGKFLRRWILTGTPAPNGLLDLFAQIYIVDQGRALGQYITHYRNKYFDGVGFGGYTWVIRDGAEKDIYKAVKPYVLRLQAEDYLDLPDILENDVPVELPATARKAYDEMETEAFALMDAFMDKGSDNFLNTEHAAAARNKCRQMANGCVYVDGKKWVNLHDAKMEALESIIEERGGKPVLVAYEFAHDYERACQYFKTQFPRIGGGVSARKADDLVVQWNNGDHPVFWVHPASAGHGLNMQGCDTADCIVWFTPPDDLEYYDQLIARLRRQGTKIKKLVVHRLVAVNTFDVAGVRRLHSKADVQTSLLDALKSYRRIRQTNR